MGRILTVRPSSALPRPSRAQLLVGVSGKWAQIDQAVGAIESTTQAQQKDFRISAESIEKMTKHQRNSLAFLEDNLEFGNDLEKLSGKLQGMIHGFKVTDTGWSERVRSKARATPGGLRGCQGVASIDVAAGRCAIRSLLHRSQGLGLTLLAMSRDGAA